MGLQLFTIRAAMTKDVAGTLKQVAAMGYEEFETYGFDPEGMRYYRLTSTKEFAQLLRDLKLTTPSGHYDLNRFASASADDLNRYVDRCTEGAHALGQSYITWPLLDAGDGTIGESKSVAAPMNAIGERLESEAAGRLPQSRLRVRRAERADRLRRHPQGNGSGARQAADRYCYGSRAARTNPNEWFKRAPGRFVMWHVKDMHKTSRDYTELGNGSIDFTRI